MIPIFLTWRKIKDLQSAVDKPTYLSAATKYRSGLHMKEIKLSDIIGRVKGMKR
jgi:hypothetical protein